MVSGASWGIQTSGLVIKHGSRPSVPAVPSEHIPLQATLSHLFLQFFVPVRKEGQEIVGVIFVCPLEKKYLHCSQDYATVFGILSTIDDIPTSFQVLPVATIKKTTYKDQVIEYIYEFILDGRFLPGDHLRESQLAKELGVSRAPVREALKELIANGVVDYRPQVGNFIALLSPKEIIDAYVTRGVLEGYAAMSTRDQFTETDFTEMKALVDKMQKAAERGRKKVVVEVGHDFHNLLTCKNNNLQLAKYMDRLSLKLHVMFCKHWSDLYSPEKIAERHMRIVTSLMSGDPADIEQTIRDHYSESGKNIALICNGKGQRNGQ